MKIGEKTLEKGGEILTRALLAYQTKINEAFLNNGEEDLKIGLSLTIKPGPADGNFKLKGDISFVTQKITDSFSDSVDEKQVGLFDDDYDEPTRPCPERPGDDVYERVCEKCKHRETILITGDNGIERYNGTDANIPPLKDNHLTTVLSCRAWADDDYAAWCDGMLLAAARVADAQKAEKPELKKIAGGKK